LGTTGRQTRIARKAGGRVTKKGAFVGEGRALGAKSDEEEVDEDMSTKGYVFDRLIFKRFESLILTPLNTDQA